MSGREEATYPQGIEPRPVCVAGVERAGRHAAGSEGEDRRALQAKAFHVCVSHVVVVNLIEILAAIAATAEQRAEERPSRGLLVV